MDALTHGAARGSWPRSACLVSLALLATGCRDAGGAGGAGHETTERVYELHCLGCHGARGEGTWGSNIQGLKRPESEIASVIGNGEGKMPAFKGHLSEAQMKALAAYVKAFKPGSERAPAR